ncbi:hypothetical protein J437_LFUL018468 [Ladona fulva]|uniref:EB domain-containing protein n=1 Tax=Ladona fulva TaxID=123851 RepID=A0A8K0PCX1_LADFU|nr:hypothetical protein J437_LFUL018468 [Ladona fulva]
MKSSAYACSTHLFLTFVFIWMSLLLKNSSTAELGQTCSTSEDCTNYLSYCSDEKKCRCQAWTVASEGRCLSEYNNFCIITGGGCTTTNAKCEVVDFTLRCLCQKNYKFNQEENECVSNNGLHSSRPPVLLLLLCVIPFLWTEIY